MEAMHHALHRGRVIVRQREFARDGHLERVNNILVLGNERGRSRNYLSSFLAEKFDFGYMMPR